MRTVLIATAALASAGTADAGQRMVVHGPDMASSAMSDGATAPLPGPTGYDPRSRPVGMQPGPDDRPVGRHWGGRDQGRWIGGVRAPGGWSSYRRPYRGYGLPGYWMSSGFRIGDWGDYGLYQPPVGYSWSRYYDDAVLIDTQGSVYDTIGGIDWPRYDLDEAQGGRVDTYNANVDQYRATAGADYAYPQGSYLQPDGSYPQPRRSDGVGGALVGGAAGGIAGGLIAGRHDKVAGALIGVGGGALAGYAIDRRAHRRDYPQAGGPGADYPPPPPGYAPGPGYPPPGADRAPPTVIRSGGGTLVTTSTVGGIAGGTYVNGYYYPPATVTTVTVASAPVVTTTTEVFEDSVTYTRRPTRKVYRRPVWHRPVCYCR